MPQMLLSSWVSDSVSVSMVQVSLWGQRAVSSTTHDCEALLRTLQDTLHQRRLSERPC